MAASDITALFFDQEEVPMALLFGPETVIPGGDVPFHQWEAPLIEFKPWKH